MTGVLFKYIDVYYLYNLFNSIKVWTIFESYDINGNIDREYI